MKVKELIAELMKYPMDSDLQVSVGNCIVTTNDLEFKSAKEITEDGDEYRWFEIPHEGVPIGTGVCIYETKIATFNYEEDSVVELFVENVLV